MKKVLFTLILALGFVLSASANVNPTPSVEKVDTTSLDMTAEVASAILKANAHVVTYEGLSQFNSQFSQTAAAGSICDGPKPAEGCYCDIAWGFQYVAGGWVYWEFAYWNCSRGNK
jgi:hypothetical protein